MRWILRAGSGAAIGLLAACSTISLSQAPAVYNPFLDSGIAAGWPSGDIEAHRVAFMTALDAPSGEKVEWAGERARGSIAANEARIVLTADEPEGKPAPVGLRTIGAMEMNLGIHVLMSNANLRLGPSTDDAVVTTLKAGTRVDVVGRLVRAPWALVAQNGRVRGYVFDELITQPAGAVSRLAGAALGTPVYCRSVEQMASVGETASEWRSIACKAPDGWRVTAH